MDSRQTTKTGVILVVEDDGSISTALCEAIKSVGYACIVASDSQSAFQLLNSRRFRAMILDLQLGNERAEELIERLDIAGIKLPPLIIVSGRPNAELRLVGRVTQAAAWLKKPVILENILTAIEIAIE